MLRGLLTPRMSDVKYRMGLARLAVRDKNRARTDKKVECFYHENQDGRSAPAVGCEVTEIIVCTYGSESPIRRDQ